MRINADDDASIDVYTKDGKTKLCTINCFDLSVDDAEDRRGQACIDVIPASKLKANALVFDFKNQGEPTFTGEYGRYRMSSHGLVCVELSRG